MDRLQQKSHLLFQLGALFSPLQHLVRHPESYNEQERAEALARYFSECTKLQNAFQLFSLGQIGYNYTLEYSKFFYALAAVENKLRQGIPLDTFLEKEISIAQAAIDAIPVPRTSVILEAGTPFTAYRRLRELCEVDATISLVWLDPFLDASIFHRYLVDVRPNVNVVLVTCPPGRSASSRDNARWTEFCTVSRLYAQERGSMLYTLRAQPNLHDRWVVFDGKRIYALGGSAKDAGSRDYFTITSVEASETNLNRIRKQVDTATELFGPGYPNHE